jgi:hypothetical protein
MDGLIVGFREALVEFLHVVGKTDGLQHDHMHLFLHPVHADVLVNLH